MRLFILLCLIFAPALYAVEDKYEFNSAEQSVLFAELGQELRCPKCQNQNIADSDAVVARDLREKVHDLVLEGKSKQEIIDYMVDRYGYFVHYKPPVTAATIILWLLPVAIVLLGLGFILLRQKRAARRESWSEQDEIRLNELIARYNKKEQGQ